MIFSDIIALARAGYSPADVKELLSMDTPSPDTPPDNPTPAGGDINKEAGGSEPKQEPEPGQEPKPIQEPETREEPTEDQKKIAELEKALAEAQKLNANKDLSDKVISDEDKLKELFRGFM